MGWKECCAACVCAHPHQTATAGSTNTGGKVVDPISAIVMIFNHITNVSDVAANSIAYSHALLTAYMMATETQHMAQEQLVPYLLVAGRASTYCTVQIG